MRYLIQKTFDLAAWSPVEPANSLARFVHDRAAILEYMTYFDDIREILSIDKISPAAKLVLIYLKDKQGDNIDCWPSISTICKECRLCRQSVITSIKSLKSIGLLKIHTAKNPSIKESNRYSVTGLKNRPVQNIDQSKICTSTGLKYRLKPVQNIDCNDSYNVPLNDSLPVNVKNFELFWQSYPKKIGKLAAQKAFKKLKNIPIENILKAIENQKQSEQWKKENGQFIPNPATWINQGRWDDETIKTENKVNWEEVDKLLEKAQ
jgi:hypothetical protein